VRARLAVVVVLASVLCACVVPSPPPAQVGVVLLAGNAAREIPEPGRVAVLVDAGADMAELSADGPSYWIGARRGAERLIGSLPAELRADLFLVGGAEDARCEDPVPGLVEPAVVAQRLAEATPSGRAALVATLAGLAEQAEGEADLARAVVFTRLSGACGGDLCEAAQRLAARDVRLDLVVIGDASPPPCLAALAHRDPARAPSGWSVSANPAFHVDSPSLDPGHRLCGEAEAHPLPVPPGEASLVVQLDPPLNVTRQFAPGSRWQLEVLDFPQLDPPVREWRWRELPPEPRSPR
jgi:hypothetical protein